MSLEDAIKEMRAMAQMYWIVYRYPSGNVGIEQISASMSYEFETEHILSPWFTTEARAEIALYAYLLRQGEPLDYEQREHLADLLENLRDQ